MRPACFSATFLLALLIPLFTQKPAWADEGWWLFSDPPRSLLKERYQFELTDAWLDYVRLASLRFVGGGSGSFVSPDGLILTNHHVVDDAIHDMSTAGRDYVRDGFLALSPEQEARCPNLEVEVLVGTEDVTRHVEEAVKPGMIPVEASKARRAVIYALEKESAVSPGLTGRVVPLLQGERYHLYRYKTYTDVRLIFAPETWIAREYDVCFLRAYEGGKPARVRHYLKCSQAKPLEGELIFMAGCPSVTRRHLTVAEMQVLRDQQEKYSRRQARRIRVLDEYRALGRDNISRSEVEYFHTAWAKTLSEEEFRLLQPGSELMRRREIRETTLRTTVDKDPRLREAYSGAWQRLGKLSERREGVERVYRLLELGDGLATKLFSFALELVRLADETGKPDAERLDGYNEVDLPALKRWLFAETAIDEGLEIRRLADSLAFLQEELSSNQDWVRQVLAGKSPGERASELIRESRLGDANVRRALAEGGRGAVASSNDPMIALARLLDGQTRKVRSELFDDVEEQIRRERLRIAAAIRAVAGHDDYPDASGTLRLSFGRVKKLDAETDADSTFWTLNSLFWSLQGRSPIAPSQIHSALEPRSIRVRRGLNFDTPFLFKSDVDCSFGNSGSPVLNQRGEQIGVLSRGPSEALYLTYEYDDQRCRGMAMHMAGIVEVLVNVYGALELVRELTGVD